MKQDFIKNYLDQDNVSMIKILRDPDSSNSLCHAVIKTKNAGYKQLVLGNVDHFLEALERIQNEKVTQARKPIMFTSFVE